jgi:hypothetical protein
MNQLMTIHAIAGGFDGSAILGQELPGQQSRRDNNALKLTVSSEISRTEPHMG